jgi:transcriptional regulator with XRE-family HTH domain
MKTIKELRTEKGLTQLEVAYRIGVTPLSVSNWERGVSVPTVVKLRALAELFGVSSDDIALMERDEGLEGKRAA